MHAKFILPKLSIPFVSHDLDAMSAIMVCSKSVSAYGVCVLCLSLEVLCVKCEEAILIKLFEPIFRDTCS